MRIFSAKTVFNLLDKTFKASNDILWRFEMDRWKQKLRLGI